MDFVEDILSLIEEEGKITTAEIQNRLDLTKETTDAIIEFLVKFGFIQLDKKGYVKLSEACKRFFGKV